MLTQLKRFLQNLVRSEPAAARAEGRLTSADYSKQIEDEKNMPKMRGN